MPEAFIKCRRRGGKIRTQRIGKDKYRHICVIDGKIALGEIKTKKKK